MQNFSKTNIRKIYKEYIISIFIMKRNKDECTECDAFIGTGDLKYGLYKICGDDSNET